MSRTDKRKIEKEVFTGAKGRKAMTSAQRKDKRGVGRPSKDLPPVEPGLVVDSFLPLPPEGLHGDAVQEWERVGRYLLLTRRVSKLDRQALVVYATSYSMFSDAIRPLIINRTPIWGRVNGRPKPAANVDIAFDHAKIVLDTARKFGMTARTRHLDHAETGRCALPEEIHKLRGSPKKFRGKAPLPEWEEESVARPLWFDPIAAREWDRLVQVLEGVDLWTPLDVSVIAISCAAYSLMTRCISEIKEEPLSLRIGDTGGAVEHPLSFVYRKMGGLCDIIWRDYGMTPSDRARFRHVEGDQQGKPKLSVYPELTS